MAERERDEALTVLAPDQKTIKCSKCKWAVNGAIKSNCMKYAQKPYDVYFKSAECPKFKSKKKFEKFEKEAVEEET